MLKLPNIKLVCSILLVTYILVNCTKKKEKDCYTCFHLDSRYVLHPAPRTDGMMGPDRRQDYITFHCDITYEEILNYEKLNTRIEYSFYNGDTTVYSYSVNCSRRE
jgi:hypothetical protein